MHLSRKLAVVTHIMPPASVGSAVRLSRLFRDVSAEDYCVIASRDLPAGTEGRLAGRHYRLPSEWRPLPSVAQRLPNQWKGLLGHSFRLFQRVHHIRQLIKETGAKSILAVSGDLFDLPAGYIASRLCNLPFYAMVDDDYTYQWVNPVDRYFAGFWEKRFLKRGHRTIVINEFMQKEYQARHDVRSILIANPAEVPERMPSDGKLSGAIVYTGAVYHMNYDGFRRLTEALVMLGDTSLKLHIHSPQSPQSLMNEGIRGPVVFCGDGRLSKSEIRSVQQSATILFLPLGFQTPIPEVIRTTAPFKLSDYMVSGRPILVNAPPDSFLTWYCKSNNCAAVVEDTSPLSLAAAIHRIESDAHWRQTLCNNAFLCAQRDFDVHHLTQKFAATLNE